VPPVVRGGRSSPPANRFSPHYQYSDTPSGSYFCRGAGRPARPCLRDHVRRAGSSTSRWLARAGSPACGPAHTAPGRRVLPARPRWRWPSAWEGLAWPSARAHSHILSALPAGSFPPALMTSTSTSSSTRHGRRLALAGQASALPAHRAAGYVFTRVRSVMPWHAMGVGEETTVTRETCTTGSTPLAAGIARAVPECGEGRRLHQRQSTRGRRPSGTCFRTPTT